MNVHYENTVSIGTVRWSHNCWFPMKPVLTSRTWALYRWNLQFTRSERNALGGKSEHVKSVNILQSRWHKLRFVEYAKVWRHWSSTIPVITHHCTYIEWCEGSFCRSFSSLRTHFDSMITHVLWYTLKDGLVNEHIVKKFVVNQIYLYIWKGCKWGTRFESCRVVENSANLPY
jgi:hypothetical protein